MEPLEVEACPFYNLPEERSGRWGEGLTADKMKNSNRPVNSGRSHRQSFEWTEDRHLRHSRFGGM